MTTTLITGANKGLGLQTARRLIAEGHTVYLGARDARRGQGAADLLGARLLLIDVIDDDSVAAAASKVREQVGHLDVLVNNAGITQDARLQKMTLEQFDRVIDVNLRGVFHCAQAVADTMVAQGSGVILNASSVVGLYGNFGQTNYAATKFGVLGFTKTWSRELGPKGVRVNAVAPGFIKTHILDSIPEKVLEDMKHRVPLHRLGTPEEIANVYCFLASDEASYINGAVIEVSGGMTV